MRELLSRYFEVASVVVRRHGGVVEKFIGDAVMAVWGSPVATEDDPERAVRAALIWWSRSGVGCRCGDRWPGGAGGGGERGGRAVNLAAVNEGMVAGDAVNTAARIQAAAAPGSVWVDGATRRLTANAISYHDEGAHPLKGKAEPQRLWRAVRVVSSVGGAQRVDGLEAPLTGRGAEMRAFVSCSTRLRSVASRGWWWCRARRGWASRGWVGSSRSTSTVWPTRCGGIAVGVCPMATVWCLGVGRGDPSASRDRRGRRRGTVAGEVA